MRGGARPDGLTEGRGLDLQPPTHALQGVGERPFRDREIGELLQGGADLIEGQPVDVLQQQCVGQDLRPQAAVRNLLRRRRRRDHRAAAPTVVAMALKTGHLNAGWDEVFLEVRGRGDGGPQRPVTRRTPGELLLHDAIDVDGRGARHARMSRLLAGALRPMEDVGEREGRTLGRMEPLGEPLDFLLETRDLLLLLVDEANERSFRQLLEIGDDGQRPSLSPGVMGTV